MVEVLCRNQTEGDTLLNLFWWTENGTKRQYVIFYTSAHLYSSPTDSFLFLFDKCISAHGRARAAEVVDWKRSVNPVNKQICRRPDFASQAATFVLILQISYLVNPQRLSGGFGPDAALFGVLTGIQTLLESSKAQRSACARECVLQRDRKHSKWADDCEIYGTLQKPLARRQLYWPSSRLSGMKLRIKVWKLVSIIDWNVSFWI